MASMFINKATDITITKMFAKSAEAVVAPLGNGNGGGPIYRKTPLMSASLAATQEDVSNNNVEDKYGAHYTTKGMLPAEIGTDYNFKRKIVWFNALGFLALHLSALYGALLCFTSVSWMTIGWMFFLTLLAGEGVTIGAHRMYSHKAFKGRFITRFALIILHTIAGQNCLYIWVRDHRQHHKYSDTDADPHNANRGFFFSHMGWLMSKKHPAVICKGKTIDMSDLEADNIVMFQKIFYKPLYVLFAMALPVGVPVYFWDETYWNSFFVSYMLRTILLLNITWCVNSAAHLFGTKPYDETIKPVESAFVSFIAVGEGWHNYHHAFPWDYRAAEFGLRLSITTVIIDILASFGLVYDLKVAPESMVSRRSKRAGDGSHPYWGLPSAEEQKGLCALLSEDEIDLRGSTIEDDENNTVTEQQFNDLREKNALRQK